MNALHPIIAAITGEAATSVTWAPYIAWEAIILLGVFVAALTVAGLFGRRRGTLWRAMLGALLLLTLANPSLVQEERAPISDVVLVVSDESQSQHSGDRLAQLEEVRGHLREQIGSIDKLELREITVPAAGQEQALDETRLFGAIEQALSDLPRRRVAGIILLSDGQIHDIPADPAAWQDMGPIHTLLTGHKDEIDRRLKIVKAPSFGLVDKQVSVTIEVEDLPEDALDRQPVRVTARKNDEPPLTFTVNTGEPQELSFTITHGGANVVELSVEPLAGEISERNNRAVIVVNGVRDRLRVLLVSGEPHAGERTWRNLLKADPAVDLVHFTILRPPEKQDGTPIRELSLIAFPIRELFELKLSEFDLVIFDRYQRRGVLPRIYLENIADFVRQGGALLNAEGPSAASPLSLNRSPLGEVLPAEPTGSIVTQPFRAQVTSLGHRHPVTAGLEQAQDNGKPWGHWFRRIDAEIKSGTVLMAAEDKGPLLVVDRVGEGRVAQLLSDHVWLWDRGFDGGGPQAELLRRIAHWLMKEPALEEERLSASVTDNTLTVERRSLDGAATTVEVTKPDGNTEILALKDMGDGLARATLKAEQPGLYRFHDGDLYAVALVGRLNPLEFSDLRASGDHMQPVADASGGAIRWIEDVPEPAIRLIRQGGGYVGGNWLGLRSNDNYRVISVIDAPLLPPLLLMLAALMLLLAGWWRESR
jgi:hypothetical protein